MIVNILIELLLVLVDLILIVLPVAGPLPEAATAWVGYFNSGVSLIGFILPMTQFFVILGLWVSIELVLIGYRIALFIYKRVRG